MLTIVPNEDGEMVAVPVHVGTGDDDHTKMAHVEGVDHGDSQVRNQSYVFSYHFNPHELIFSCCHFSFLLGGNCAGTTSDQ